MVYTLGACMAL